MRFTSDSVYRAISALNATAGSEIVDLLYAHKSSAVRTYVLQWKGVISQSVNGARAACDTLDAARYAIEAMKAAQGKAAMIQPDQTRHLLSMEENGSAR